MIWRTLADLAVPNSALRVGPSPADLLAMLGRSHQRLLLELQEEARRARWTEDYENGPESRA